MNHIKIELHSKLRYHFYIKNEKMLYRIYKKRRDISYLRCIIKSCACRAKIVNGQFQRTNVNVHGHGNHAAKGKSEICYSKMKQAVLLSQQSVRKIHYDATKNLPVEVLKYCTWQKIGNHLTKIRRSTYPSTQNIDTFVQNLKNDINVKDRFGKFKGEQFFRKSVQVGEHHITIFIVEQFREVLTRNCSLYCDGTFKILPLNYQQLYIIMADIDGRPRPLVFALMTNRTKVVYEALFKYLKNKWSITPGNIMCDFEQAVRSAALQIWPDVTISGCNFHFCQALRRKAMSIPELSQMLGSSDITHRVLKMFMRLSLLPITNISEGLKEVKHLIERNQMGQTFEEFWRYFSSTWYKGKYNPYDWCTSALKYRTNNHVEGFNHALKVIIKKHQNPWIFLEGLQEVVFNSLQTYIDDRRNNMHIQSSKSQLSKALEENLAKLANNAITVLQFLDDMSKI